MKFKEEYIPEFIKVFEKQKEYIANFDGCTYLELLQDYHDPQTFFTYSQWLSEDALNNYRKSDFFKSIWSNVKTMFSDKPKAWSLTKYE